MELEDIGYNKEIEQIRINNNLLAFEVGRVIAEHKERYIVKTVQGECDAEITGNLRFTAKNREDFPAVGDWVALTVYESSFAIIHAILPRFSVLKRKAVGHYAEIQIIAANIDFAFIVQAVDRDFNINRIERYLTICNSSKVKPIIVLSKIDLISDKQLSEILTELQQRIKNIQIITISNFTNEGVEKVSTIIEKGKTYCMLGSSGVGKSTLINNLAGKNLMKTDSISQFSNRGKHVTSHRELIVLENGGILIDNPGMREVGIADSDGGLEITFDKITELSQYCKFKDCTHINEMGCAVLEAIENGEIDKATYDNYLKMVREQNYFTTTVVEKRKKEKAFGKIIKDYHKKNIKNRN